MLCSVTDLVQTTHPLAIMAFAALVLVGLYIFAMAMIAKDEKKWHDTYSKELHNAYERMNNGKSNRS
jgi:hypothetical protein